MREEESGRRGKRRQVVNIDKKKNEGTGTKRGGRERKRQTQKK